MGDVTSSVSASGTVISPGDVGVSPSVNGQLTSIHVKVGDRVSAGEVLAELDHTSLKNAMNSASAALKTTQIQLQQSQTAIQTAKDNATNNAVSYQEAVNSARRALDEATANIELKKKTYQLTLDGAQAVLNQAKSVYSSYADFYGPSGITLSWCESLNTINSNCTTLISDYNAFQSAQKSYDSAVANQAISVAADSSNLVNLNTAWTSALATQRVGIAKDQLAVTTAQQNFEIAKAQQGVNTDSPALVDLHVAQSALELAQKNYEASFIKAPVSGTVASISATVGQNAPTASSSTVGSVSGFIVLTDVSSLQVSAGFSESDAAKLVAGQNVNYTFAALPNLSATGKLLSIDLLPTTTSGATSYKATFAITEKVPTLKPGMTATVTVTTGAAINVLQVASQAVTIRGSGASVNVITTVAGKEVITRTPVVVGLQGDSADQIISGIQAGTKVVLRSVSASVGTNGFPSVGIPAGLGGAGLGGAAGGGGGRGGRNGG
jgi:multidrug efflux pump subunit AcrA (membrane-fusion protein)